MSSGAGIGSVVKDPFKCLLILPRDFDSWVSGHAVLGLSPPFHPHSLLSDGRSVQVGCTRFIRCCYLIIDLRSPFRRKLVQALAQSPRSEEHTSELQSQFHLVCRLLLEKKK